jgi:hypothetical protein
MVLFGFAAGPLALCFAQRAFCAKLIFLRPAADMVRDVPLELTLPSAASASSIRWSCFCACSRSFFNCWTTTDIWFMWDPPAEMIAGTKTKSCLTTTGLSRESGGSEWKS